MKPLNNADTSTGLRVIRREGRKRGVWTVTVVHTRDQT